MATESFFSNASLAYLASAGAGKDGKTYSIKPTDGTGDFTFSRGSNLAATRVGADGLIEKGRENIALWSEDLTQSDWTKLGVTITADSDVAPNGTTTADKVTHGSATGQVNQIINSMNNGVFTYSFYSKYVDTQWIRPALGTNTDYTLVWFDIQNGVLGTNTTAGASVYIDSSITDVGNGWYRCSITAKNGSSSNNYVQANTAGADGSNPRVIGSFLYWGIQCEQGLAATDVISTGATTGKAGLLEDEPRFDYSGGATCPSLLLEPSRTQLIGQSEYFGGSDWTNSGTSVVSGFTSPEGLSNAYKLVEDSANSTHFINSSEFATPDTTYSSSVYIKADGRNKVGFRENSNTGIYASFNLSDGTLIETSGVSASIELASNGWYRINYELTSGNNYILGIYLLSDSYTSGDPYSSPYQGDGTSGAYIWGAQTESASYPTSYIPNHSGGSVTRGADLCVDAGDATTLNDSEGVLYAEVKTSAPVNLSANSLMLSINDGTNFNEVRFEFFTSNRLYASVRGADGEASTVQTITQTNYNKIAIKYTSSGCKFFVNGVGYAFDGKSISGLNAFSFSRANTTTSPFYGDVKQVLYFPTALSDADLATLTTI